MKRPLFDAMFRAARPATQVRFPVAIGRIVSMLALVGGAAVPSRARAADAPGITSNNYTLQIYQGPVTTATRVIGLGGAYAALAEYAEGVYVNSASPAVRVPWSVSRFDWDVSLSLTAPGTFHNTDFENRGRIGTTNRFSNALNLGAGFQAQYANFGATVSIDYSSYNLDRSNSRFLESSKGSIGLPRAIIALGYGLFHNQLIVGAGLRGAFLGVFDIIPNLGAFGLAPHVGVIWSPAKLPLRVGASYRDSVSVTDIHGTESRGDGSQIAQNRILPSRAVLPWEFQAGVMLGLGGWPNNGEWTDPESDEEPVRQRYEDRRTMRLEIIESRVRSARPEQRTSLHAQLERDEVEVAASEDAAMARELKVLEERRAERWASWSRRGVMVVADVLVTGGSPNSVGVEDFLDQRLVPFGFAPTISPRLGVESEVWPNWVKARTGTYVEPSRFHDGYPRSHFTAGFDVRLFVFNPWGLLSSQPLRLRLAADLAPRYSNFGLGLGSWH